MTIGRILTEILSAIVVMVFIFIFSILVRDELDKQKENELLDQKFLELFGDLRIEEVRKLWMDDSSEG